MIKKLFLLILILVLLTPNCLANTKNTAIQMTNCLETSTLQSQFNFAENIGDNRGISVGCIGFCTGTYDCNIMIKYYTTLNPNNSLAKYIPALNKIDAGPHLYNGGDSNPNVKGLNGFIKDVHNNKDPLFKQAQLYELDQLYWNPSQTICNGIGVKYPLTYAFVYDMCIRHGEDGAKSIIKKAGKTPKQGMDEKTFLNNLIKKRDTTLWGEQDSNRDAGFKKIVASGNFNLNTPFTFVAYGDKFIITGDLGVNQTTTKKEIQKEVRSRR